MRVPRKDIRSNRVVLISFCLLCQAYQAEGIVRDHPAAVKPVLDVLLDRDVNMVQLPCPETLFSGLRRQPAGFGFYDTPEFRRHCSDLAEGILQTVRTMTDGGLQILAVIGVEFSPSCAVKYQYSGRLVKRRGLFMEALDTCLTGAGYGIPLVGVTRHGTGPAVRELVRLLA